MHSNCLNAYAKYINIIQGKNADDVVSFIALLRWDMYIELTTAKYDIHKQQQREPV